MHAAFEIEAQHGAIVVRDSAAEGDLSNVVETDARVYFDRDAALLGVVPGVDGPVRCEIWVGRPTRELPHAVLWEEFRIRDALTVVDPAGLIKVELATVRGDREILVLVDDLQWPEQVQIVVDPGAS